MPGSSTTRRSGLPAIGVVGVLAVNGFGRQIAGVEFCDLPDPNQSYV